MGWWHAVRSRLRRRPGVLLGAVVVVLLLGAAQLTPEGRGIEASGLGRTGGTTDQATGPAAPPDLGGSPEPSGTPLSQVTPSESPSPTDTPTTPPPTSAPAQTRGTASVPATAPAAPAAGGTVDTGALLLAAGSVDLGAVALLLLGGASAPQPSAHSARSTVSV